MNGAVKISLLNYELELLPEKGIYWNQQHTLFVADTHFGKEATFRFHHVPVPEGSTAGTLRSIGTMVERTDPQTLVILGDMFHAKSSLSKTTCEQLQAFRQHHPTLQIKLVPGNHDRPLGTLPTGWEIEIIPAGEFTDGLAVGHEPDNFPSGAALMLCGHLHPAVHLKSVIDQPGRLPCFWWHKKRLILPAIGDFTGCSTIRPTRDDGVWVVADRKVISYPHRKFPKSKHASS